MNKRLHSFFKVILLMALLYTGLDMSGQTAYDKLYWNGYNPLDIESINLNGTGRTMLYPSSNVAFSLEVDVPNQKMYWCDLNQDAIIQSNLDGTNASVFLANVIDAQGISMDFTNHVLYFTSTATSTIEKVNLDGTGRTVVVGPSNAGQPESLKVDSSHQKLYWFDHAAYAIKRCNMDGTGVEVFVNNSGNALQLDIDETNSKLYWPNWGMNILESINLDGTSRTTILSGFANVGWPLALAVDKVNNKIYWWDADMYYIKRVNTNGTGFEVFLNDIYSVAAMIIPVAQPTSISSNPSAATICAGGTTTFSVTASNATGYQWQVNSGSGFTDISNGGAYSGATTATLTITEATSEMNGSTYRCIASANSFPDATSESASLTVSENITYYEDFDGDGYGNGSVTIDSCTGAPEGFVSNFSDCDDDNPTTYPGAIEICGDGIDNNCDGTTTDGCIAVIDSQPSSSTICAGGTTSFSITSSNATGYVWKLFSSSGGFIDLIDNAHTGINTATLTVTDATVAMNGNRYVCIAFIGNDWTQGTISSPATLTVDTEPVITYQPSSNTICEGQEALFFCNANATSYQWQVSDENGVFTNLENGTAPAGGSYSGVNNSEMYINNLTLSMSGLTYRCIATNACSSINSEEASLTVFTKHVFYRDQDEDGYGNPNYSITSCEETEYGFVSNPNDCNDNDPSQGGVEICGDGIDNNCDGNIDNVCDLAIDVQPVSTTICAGSTITFSVTASNATGYQWQLFNGSSFTSINNGSVYGGGTHNGTTTATLTITGATSGINSYGYRCVVTGTTGSLVTSTVGVTVNGAPTFYTNPSSSSVCESDMVYFNSGAYYVNGYQWQVDSGSGYVNVTDGDGPTGGSYSGATSSNLSISDVTSEMSGHTYRCIASGTCSPNATSQSASLTVYANTTYYEDFDGDGYGNAAVTTNSCTGAPTGFVTNLTDCDDTNADVYPGAEEICGDGIDNNCNGSTEEECPFAIISHPDHEVTICLGGDGSFSVTTIAAIGYQWQVNDGYGYTDISNGELYSGADTAMLTIITPSMEMNGYVYRCIVTNGVDTATSDPGLLFIKTEMVFTGQPYPAEWCLGEVATYTCYASSATNYQWQVNNGAGFTDLEDEDVSEGGHYSDVHTRELSIYNLTTAMEGFTYRCIASNACAPDVTSDHAVLMILDSENAVYYEDADGDGYGNPDSSISYCYLPEGYVLNADDCNDNDPSVYPGSGAEEICGDGIDNNCDGQIDEDCGCSLTAIWTGNGWFPSQPSPNTMVYIYADYTSTGDLEACDILVNQDAVVTIASGHNLIVGGKVLVAPGSRLVFHNGANLLQNPLATTNENFGSITFHKDSNALYNLDYTLWSSPTSATQSLKDFSSGTLDANFFVYNTELSAYSNYLSASGIFGGNPSTVGFTPGKGYLVRMPAGLPAGSTSVFNGVFEGTPNNGDISLSLSNLGGRFNAVGNPYPSPISIRDFIDANQAQMDNGTLYFWRKTNLAQTATYVTVTNMGSAAVDQPSDSSGSFTGDPSTWVIQPGQGFLFKASTTATGLSFNNTMRRASGNGQFFRSGAAANELSRLWLDISNNSTSFGQAVIGYSDVTTNGLDFGWDGRLYNDSDLSVYTKAESTKLAIQARASFTADDAVPVSYKANNAGTFTLKMSNYDGLFAGDQQVYLKDNVFNSYHDLKAGAYTFSSEAGTFEGRFEVVYQNAALGTDNPAFDANNVILYKEGGTLKIDAGNVSMKQVDLFDIRGRLLYSATDVNATKLAISDLMVAQQVLIVQITGEDNSRTSKKIIY